MIISTDHPATISGDYVIETGTSGNWRYSKWNSGRMEMWGRGTLTGTVTNTTGSAVWISAAMDAIEAYPVAFADDPIVTYAAAIHSGGKAGFVMPRGNTGNATKPLQLCICRLDSISGEMSLYVHFYVSGWWK